MTNPNTMTCLNKRAAPGIKNASAPWRRVPHGQWSCARAARRRTRQRPPRIPASGSPHDPAALRTMRPRRCHRHRRGADRHRAARGLQFGVVEAPRSPLYSGQHEQTTDGLGAALRAADRDHRQRPQRRRGHPRQPVDRAAGLPLPGRRVPPRRTRPGRFTAGKGPAVPGRPGHPQGGDRQVQLPGNWVECPPGSACSSTTRSLISESQLHRPACCSWRARGTRGKLAFAAGETDFQPIVTSVIKAYGRRRPRSPGSTASNRTRPAHIVPDNETIADDVNRGQVAFGVSESYWYRLEAGDR